MPCRWSFIAVVLGSGCGSEAAPAPDLAPDTGTIGSDASSDATTAADAEEDAGFRVDAPSMEVTPLKPTIIYANTDKELYRMDPATKAVTRIGAFVGTDGSPLPDTMTDVAVNALEKVYACSVGKIFTLEVPAATGPVKATQMLTVTGPRMYALGIAPAGVLDVSETLVAGDAAGDLFWIPETGAPVKLGGFGAVVAGDPGLGTVGDSWQLSGDIAFFQNNGAPIGLATVRPCTTPGDTSTCKTGNDVLVEIDVAALSTKSGTANLKKGFIGTGGTGFGRLYGVAAFDDRVFAFQRITTKSGITTALLVSVSLADGKGTTVADFPEVVTAMNGWSGAGVTTSAKIFIPK